MGNSIETTGEEDIRFRKAHEDWGHQCRAVKSETIFFAILVRWRDSSPGTGFTVRAEIELDVESLWRSYYANEKKTINTIKIQSNGWLTQGKKNTGRAPVERSQWHSEEATDQPKQFNFHLHFAETRWTTGAGLFSWRGHQEMQLGLAIGTCMRRARLFW